MPTPPSAFPTIPNASSIGDRRGLLGGLAFIEGSPTWNVRSLNEWFEQHVVATGCMPRLAVLTEHPAGYIALRPGGFSLDATEAALPRVLELARTRVVTALRGLVSRPIDDRFLTAAIFTGRVRRRMIGGVPRWMARPEPTAPLSGIVLSLLAVDILSNRELYDRELCVCNACGRISFDGRPEARHTCFEHAQIGDRVSGVSLRAVAPSKADVG